MLGDFLPLTEFLRKFRKIEGVTLLGIGPVTRNTIIAGLELAAEHDFPLFLIASRNQVDSDEFGAGYLSGWNQQTFVNGVGKLAEAHAFPRAVYFCRDHGGPYQRDSELNRKIPHDQAMEIGRVSFLGDLQAGFDLLHIDPTKNPFLTSSPDPLQTVIDDTLDLIAFVEQKRRALSLPEVSYEVGTEDIKGGLTRTDRFSLFLSRLKEALRREKLPSPDFVVGQTGTLVKLETNFGAFCPEIAADLSRAALRNDCFLKEHNADYLDAETLKMHPVIGVSAANVAPEFGITETRALMRLSYLAEPTGRDFRQALAERVFQDDRWQKWLPENLKTLAAADIRRDPGLHYRVVLSCGHYHLDEPDVAGLRKVFFEKLARDRKMTPERDVVESIKEAIFRYVKNFDLIGVNKKVERIS